SSGSGSVNTDLRLPLNIKPKYTGGVVTFIFDDGLPSAYTKAFPIFQSMSVPGVSAVISSSSINYIPGNLTPSQLLEMQNAGWEIASHTRTHPDLTTLSSEQLNYELSQSKIELESVGLTVNNLVYPYNSQNLTVRNAARKYYRAARGGQYQINPAASLVTYALDNIQIDDHTLINTFKSNISTAVSQGRWVIFYMHDIDTDDENTLVELISYAKASGAVIGTMNQALDLMANRFEISENFYATDSSINLPTTVINGDETVVGHITVAGSVREIKFNTTENKARLLSNNDGKFYWQSGTTFTQGSTSDVVFSGIYGAPERLTIKANGSLIIHNVPSYANNAAALSAGLVVGDLYRNGDILQIVHA
ncbi:MAG: polysaccharide deacetylase family protein, partial [Methanogenium sp.]